MALYTYAMGRGESADLTFAIASILVLIVLLINIFTMVLGKEKKTERD